MATTHGTRHSWGIGARLSSRPALHLACVFLLIALIAAAARAQIGTFDSLRGLRGFYVTVRYESDGVRDTAVATQLTAVARGLLRAAEVSLVQQGSTPTSSTPFLLLEFKIRKTGSPPGQAAVWSHLSVLRTIQFPSPSDHTQLAPVWSVADGGLDLIGSSEITGFVRGLLDVHVRVFISSYLQANLPR
jgi:hypothetical protein